MYKHPAIEGIKSEDLMYNMVTIGNNTLLYNWNWLRVEFKCSHSISKCSDGYID